MYNHTLMPKSCTTPQCGGDVSWNSWDSDCRWNDGGYAISCSKCGRRFTLAEGEAMWDKIKATKKAKSR